MRKINQKSSVLLIIIIFYAAFGLAVADLYGEKNLSELDDTFQGGKKAFFHELELRFGLCPLKYRLVFEDIQIINHAEESIPYIYENLINIIYLKDSPRFEFLIAKGDEESLKIFREKFIMLSQEAADRFVESLFQEQTDNKTNLREAISKGKTRLDLVCDSIAEDGSVNETEKEGRHKKLNKFDLSNQWGFDIAKFKEAHGFTRGKGVKIAIVDSGIDLKNRFIKKANINHDFDFCLINRRKAPWDKEKIGVIDENGHGTVIASIVSATAPESEIHIYKVRYDQNHPFPYWLAYQVAQAIYKAVYDQADVILVSPIFNRDFKFLKAACQFAYENNVILVSPNGTSSYPDPAKPHEFPADYNTTVAVAGVVPGPKNKAVSWQKSGASHYTSVAAPAFVGELKGQSISKVETSLSLDNSWAAAFCGGLVALISSRIPKTGKELHGQYFQRIYEILTKSAVPHMLRFKSFDPRIGYGLIDAEASVNQGLEVYLEKMRKIEDNFKKRMEERAKQEEEKRKKESKKREK